MIVYIDVLICLNTFVNYFILLISSKINHSEIKISRHLLSAIVGAFFSLYIFIPKQHPIVEMFIKLLISFIIVFCNYGFHGLKSFLRKLGTFYIVSFLYAGLMLALWFTFRPSGMAINNGIVYFNISPITLIVTTIICYLIITLIRKFTKKPAALGGRKTIEIDLDDKTIRVNALIDTGHSLKDMLTDSDVIVVDSKVISALFSKETCKQLLTVGASPPAELENRYRVIPYSVIGGRGLLPAFKCDRVRIIENDKTVKDPIVAVSDHIVDNDYGAIISPELICE